MIVDIQGVKGVLTDPQIHCLDQSRFGDGNLGYYGMISFFLNHKCNKYCEQLKLVHPIKDEKIPRDFDFFEDRLVRPVIPDEILNKICDLCRNHFPLKAISYYYQKLDYPEMYCRNCDVSMKKSMKEGTCIDCKAPFRSSEFWFKMKRTDFPVRCSPCRLLLRNKMRQSL
jgi:hypothetical protein